MAIITSYSSVCKRSRECEQMSGAVLVCIYVDARSVWRACAHARAALRACADHARGGGARMRTSSSSSSSIDIAPHSRTRPPWFSHKSTPHTQAMCLWSTESLYFPVKNT